MQIQPDGSILIRAAIDGPFTEILSKRVQSITPNPTLMQHLIEHGRPATIDHAARQEQIKSLIKQLQSKNPTLTFVQAWTRLRETRPELFDD